MQNAEALAKDVPVAIMGQTQAATESVCIPDWSRCQRVIRQQLGCTCCYNGSDSGSYRECVAYLTGQGVRESCANPTCQPRKGNQKWVECENYFTWWHINCAKLLRN